MKKSTIFGTLLAISLFVLVFGCSGTNTDYQEGNAQETPAGPTIELLSHEIVNENGIIEVKGEAEALTDLSYAEVDVKFYDSEHRLIYSSFTNVVDLKKGDIWLFTVWGPSDPVESYEIQVTDSAF
jgi:hypothetical protein